MHRFFMTVAGVVLCSVALGQNCAGTSVGLTPLNDLGTGTYLGAQGGLYPAGSNLRPGGHDAAGRAIGASMVPLDGAGNPSPQGAVVLLSIGMSNTTQEYSAFVNLSATFANLHPRVRVIDGAQGGQHAEIIVDPTANFWTVINQRLAQAGLTPAQVQAVWIKQALPTPGSSFPPGSFPGHPQHLQSLLATISQIVKDKFPNCRQAFVSSRIYAGYASTALNPEPYAYDSGFAVKWLVEDQINGNPALNFTPSAGAVEAPWLAWGPYMWADGLTARSDGLTWLCSDYQADGTHPAAGARSKVANMLLGFFSRDMTTRRWFVRRPVDVTDDGVVNFADLNGVLSTFGQTSGGGAMLPGDANLDGAVNFADLNAVLSQFGT
ncbi:MAG: hypothetical protein AB7G17_06295 [Phycisphaerales bacterium]